MKDCPMEKEYLEYAEQGLWVSFDVPEYCLNICKKHCEEKERLTQKSKEWSSLSEKGSK